MSFSLPSLRGLTSRFLTRPTTLTPTPFTPSTTTQCLAPTTRTLSTTPSILAPPGAKNPFNKGAKAGGKPGGKPQAGGKKKGGKRGAEEQRDPKMINMLSHFAVLSPNRIPPPLRMGRNRHLRHWTIHRAWLLFRRREREARERNLMRQHQSMSNACEALRQTSGPGTRDEGYLFRVAMEKKGVYGLHGVPIEYARAQTETPAKVAWNHDWKR
jgi:large subunit ribosomal protein L40